MSRTFEQDKKDYLRLVESGVSRPWEKPGMDLHQKMMAHSYWKQKRDTATFFTFLIVFTLICGLLWGAGIFRFDA